MSAIKAEQELNTKHQQILRKVNCTPTKVDTSAY